MNTTHIFLPMAVILMAVSSAFNSHKSPFGEEPWRPDQLMDAGDLARLISDSIASQPMLLSIGPAAVIKNSIDIGAVHEQANFEKLAFELDKLSRDSVVVIYCGCCPFNHCPNIRPAFRLMNEMKFTRHKLLNLPRNIKMDWLDKGYPVNEN